MKDWDLEKGKELYGISNWGEGYFDINDKGNIIVRPSRNGRSIDLLEIVTSLTQRGFETPILLRFDGIIRSRIQRLQEAFANAIQGAKYGGRYHEVFPIKVNQQRHVVDSIRLAGKDHQLGLEVGSKPELCAVFAIHDTAGALLLCNGYKDKEYIELALLSRKLGRRAIVIVEQLHELDLVIETASRLGIDAEIGFRMKPFIKASGHWESSGGDNAKFGLSTSEIVTGVNKLREYGKSDWLKLLHYHSGSQITSIASIQKILRESTRMYTELAKLCPSLCFFDVGGGLAVDYDGSQTNFSSSMNYTLEEYARDVIDAIADGCKEAGVGQPDIITESGRAISAHHAVLVVQVADVAECEDGSQPMGPPPTEHEALRLFQQMHENLTAKNCHETLNDALALRDEVLERFVQGDLSLIERAYADSAFWKLVARIRQVASTLRHLPEDIEKLSEPLRDTYFCSFSVFQSLPDIWAIEQLFPVMPIHRLKEEPTRRAILADMSCDSDGKIDRFVDLKDVKSALPLHRWKTEESYFLGIFLVGAYQEILGDLHNLFGDTHAVHLDFSEDGEVEIKTVVPGDTVKEVLSYVQYDSNDLTERLRVSIERAMKDGRITAEESAQLQRRYREALEGYTYFQV